MFLKSLDMYGFKSFADKTHIDFTDGITGLLGPNGCGKSNIVNAIQWVLGEKSTKTLRLSQMAEVIFNGTDTRKQMDFAEVRITIDNSDHLLPSDLTEIEVGRRIVRGSPNNEYFLNRQPCKLSDISSLFMDTGIGKSSYSIMEQGKIDQILNTNPIERRVIFEEAAGISRYKQDTVKAEQNLVKANENIAQAETTLTSVHRQYSLLKGQAEKAQKAHELKALVFSLEVDVQLNSVIGLRKRKEEIQQQVSQSGQRLAELSQELEESKAQRQSLEDEQAAHAEKIRTLETSETQLSTRLEGYDERLKFVTDQFQNACRNKSTADERAASYKQKLEESQEARDAKQDDLKDLEDAITALNEKKQANVRKQDNALAALETAKGDIAKSEEKTYALQTQLDSRQDELAQITEDIVGQIDEQVRKSGYSSEGRAAAEKDIRDRIARLKGEVGKAAPQKLSSDIDALAQAFGDFCGHIPALLDTFGSSEGIIGRKHAIDKDIARIKEEIAAEEKTQKELNSRIDSLNADIDAARAAIQEVNLALAKAGTSKDGIVEILQQMEQAVSEMTFTYHNALDLAEKSEEDIQRYQDDIRRIDGSKKDDTDKLAEVRDELAAEKQISQEISQKISAIIQKQQDDAAEVNQIKETVAGASANIQNLDKMVADVYNNFFENYGKSLKEYDERLTSGEVEDYGILRNKLNSAKKELSELGNINEMALDDFQDVEKQYNFLTRQLDDLNKAKADLEGILADIKTKSANQFTETYNAISENFQILYRKLFGGGKAELRLDDPENVLESGIEIFAQPPGKKLLRLSLLSGGERTMTAVALLFATYQVKPSPFCILDELDAALDDRNIGNFLTVLQEFSQKSQFIIITHNKHTVMGAQQLIGVTQIEAGVSIVVTYKIGNVAGEPVILDAENKAVDFTPEGKRVDAK